MEFVGFSPELCVEELKEKEVTQVNGKLSKNVEGAHADDWAQRAAEEEEDEPVGQCRT